MFTQLDDDDVRVIAAAFGLGAVHAWAPIAAGTVNSNFTLATERGRFILRVNEDKSLAEVRYEATLVNALVDAGIPAPRPVVSGTGEPWLVDRGRLLSVFPWVAGVHVFAPDIGPGHTVALGRELARLHLAGLPLAPGLTHAGRYTFERIVERASALFGHEDPVLAPALEVAREEIAWLVPHAAVRAAATTGVIHNDLFPENVLFAAGPDADPTPAVVALIDFEQASTGSLAFDLAVCINAWCGDDLEPEPGADRIDGARVRALVAGYESVRPLPRADARALQVELRASALRFLVTRITDVYLRGVDKPRKDFRHFSRRLAHWRANHVMDLLARSESMK